jgi:hypothetical protein
MKTASIPFSPLFLAEPNARNSSGRSKLRQNSFPSSHAFRKRLFPVKGFIDQCVVRQARQLTHCAMAFLTGIPAGSVSKLQPFSGLRLMAVVALRVDSIQQSRRRLIIWILRHQFTTKGFGQDGIHSSISLGIVSQWR